MRRHLEMVAVNFGSREDIELAGFTGFVPIKDLQTATQRKVICAERGLYMILRVSKTPPQFEQYCLSHGKVMPATPYPVTLLEAKWLLVKESVVVYIGQAGGSANCEGGILGDSNLRKRLSKYMRLSKSHSGGRAIWQLNDSDELLVCWKVIRDADPKQIECRLLREFVARYRSLPFANWL